MNDYEIIITYKCNWNCEYCCVDTHRKNEPSKETVFNKLDQVLPNSKVTLSGGEPGLLDEGYLIEIFEFLKNKNTDIGINTNGHFIKRYPQLFHYVSNINYHCSEDLDLEKSFIMPNDTKFSGRIDYLLVVHDKNLDKLEAFLNKYPDIIFNVVPASTPLSGIQGAPILTKKFEILKKHYNRINHESRKRLLTELDFSKIIYL